jgi:hypothetical protein
MFLQQVPQCMVTYVMTLLSPVIVAPEQVHKAECPSTFVICPDLPPGVELDAQAAGAAMSGWTSCLTGLFSRK